MPDIRKWENAAGVVIEIDYDLCGGAGECIENCPMDVYVMEDGKPVASNAEDCAECCTCVEVCPVNAISHSSC